MRAAIPKLVGAPVQRREDPALIRGEGTYVGDVEPAGTLHLAVVRSPYPHARVTAVDVEGAAKAPGAHLVLTPEDVADVAMPPPPDPKRNVPHRRPLVQGKALMPGDPVAAVVAETPALARDAADLVMVDYDPLPVVGDVEEAIDAPPLHEEFGTNVAYDRSHGDRADVEALPGPVVLEGTVE
ncbi:MAG: xanthine dehydrogenase family protein molybdopterin-binding subunit, partial [Acidimicrobiia bacterium]